MRYVIIGHDVPNFLEQRLAARPEHLARLTALRDAGRLTLAGPARPSTALTPARPVLWAA